METNPSSPTDLVPVRRALLSVSDKTGLIEFATALVNEFKVTLISTGGTATHLRDAGLDVTDVSEVTGFPEMMDGRVKTLHPKVHGGLLAQREQQADHLAAMAEHDIQPIDLLCINLYPFARRSKSPGVTLRRSDRKHRHRRPRDDPLGWPKTTPGWSSSPPGAIGTRKYSVTFANTAGQQSCAEPAIETIRRNRRSPTRRTTTG